MYQIGGWDEKAELTGSEKVQYLPDIQEVVRKMFGEQGAVVVEICKMEEN